MKSFSFKTDGGRFPDETRTLRKITFRAKGKHYPHDNWVVGSYIFTDDCINDPFGSKPIKETHYITSYYPGDWGMGGWNNSEVFPQTVQQHIGMTDSNFVDIYEGDIVRIYYGVSYDEDGTMTLSDEYRDVLVGFKDTSFMFGDEPVSEFEPKETFKFFVIGNVYDTLNHQVAKDYHVDKLCREFDSISNLPEEKMPGVLDFVHTITKIPMLDTRCFYKEKDDTIRVVFEVNGKRFSLSNKLSFNETENEDNVAKYLVIQYSETVLDGQWYGNDLDCVINKIMGIM